MSKSVWQDIFELANAGMAVEVTLKPEWQLMREKLPPGRPFNPPEKQDYLHYKGNHLPGKRPICKARGCRNYLRIDQALWCNEDCQHSGMGNLNGILSKLNEQEIEELLRTHLDPDFRVVKVERESREKKRPRRRRYRYETPNFSR